MQLYLSALSYLVRHSELKTLLLKLKVYSYPLVSDDDIDSEAHVMVTGQEAGLAIR